MNILTLNCGSSSLKYRLIAMPAEIELAGGEAQRIGPPTALPSRIVYHTGGQPPHTLSVKMPDHATAFEEIMRLLAETAGHRPDVIGHRIVHGGSQFTSHVLVGDGELQKLESLGDMAPLHNPPATRLLQACRRRYPDMPQVAVFDTAFHASIPAYASAYALPRPLRAEHGFRKYGFHGISHEYVTREAARFLKMPPSRLNAVSCHIGSGGASLCAVVRGRSVDNTMGYSPLQGLIMSTRCGDLDPAVTLRLLALSQGDRNAVEKLLNERSGVLGLSGKSADIRDIFSIADAQSDPASRMGLTAQAYLWRLRKYLGAYLAVAGRADAILFTDTLGETSPLVRWAMCADLGAFGVRLDPERNRQAEELPVDVADPDSRVRVLVIRTNEELAIARYSFAVIEPAHRAVPEGSLS